MRRNKHPKYWWKYILHIRNMDCANNPSEDCSKKIHKDLKLSYKTTMECVNDSFTDKDHNKGDNTILRSETRAREASGHLAVPSLFINKVFYKSSNLEPKKVYDQICNSFLDPQEECDQM